MAALADDPTVGAIFAVGAVLVAVLTSIVAVLSYAQQAAVPFADIVKVLEALLEALKKLKEQGQGQDDEAETATVTATTTTAPADERSG